MIALFLTLALTPPREVNIPTKQKECLFMVRHFQNKHEDKMRRFREFLKSRAALEKILLGGEDG